MAGSAVFAFKFLFITLALFAASCSEPVTELTPLSDADTLTTDVHMPTIMKMNGEKLLVVDLFTKDSLVRIFDVNRKTIVSQFAQKGHGPNEYLHISSADFSMHEGQLVLDVFDPVKKILSSYPVDELLKGNTHSTKTDFKTTTKANLTEVLRIEGGFMATGLFEEGKYAMFDDSLKFRHYSGEYLTNVAGKTKGVKHAIANNGTTIFDTDRKHFTGIVYMASVVTFNHVNDLSVEKDDEYQIKPLNYQVKDDHIINQEVEGYLSASYGKQHIYTLYCGIPESDGVATYGKEIHVFSKDGKLQKKYLLGASAFQICVNDDESKLYVLLHEPTPCILIYDL